ncbi:MAG: SCO family protein [Leptospira sp.]|nr:SCO family protein [Leptospira sp.]
MKMRFVISIAIALCIASVLVFFIFNRHFKEDGFRDTSLTFFAKPKNDKLPHFRGKDLEAFWPNDSRDQQDARKVNKFEFKNQMGKQVDQNHFQNKITVVSFFFAKCHGICPNIVRNLKFVQSRYLKDDQVQIVSYSVTPDLDTPEELNKFAEQKGIYHTKWNLLTGDRVRVFELARNTFQADTNTTNKDPNRDFVHSEQIFLIGPDLNFRGVYNGNKSDSVKTMIEDILILEKESNARSGT